MPATRVAGIFIMGFVRVDSRDKKAQLAVSLDRVPWGSSKAQLSRGPQQKYAVVSVA